MTVLSRRGPLYGVNGALVHGGSVVEADGTDAVSTDVDSLAVDAEVDVDVDGGVTDAVFDGDGGDSKKKSDIVAGLG